MPAIEIDTGPSEDVSFRASKPPVYPPVAIRESFGAQVMLKVQVNADGSPGAVELLTLDLHADPRHQRAQPATDAVRADVSQALAQNSIAAVKTWRFNPATHAGKAVEGWVQVPITYALTGGGT